MTHAIQHVAIYGSTGSIGASTLSVIEANLERYRVSVLVANRQVEPMLEQIVRFRPRWVAMADTDAGAELERLLPQRIADPDLRPEVVRDPLDIERLGAATEVDVVVAAIVGTAGLASTWAAVNAGKRILLANKESLVAAGALMMTAARASGARILPIDSEHNAIFQCLHDGDAKDGSGVDRLILTASGGPFRTLPAEQFAAVTPEQACRHPNWSMGRKISVDSATMMNKGLEVIEAHWLFDMSPDRIEVAVHPQSIIHSLVQFVDGSMLAQLGSPDMRIPIAHGLAWPERVDSGAQKLDLFAMSALEFEAPDLTRFPCLRLAYDSLSAGGIAPLAMNAANEVAVAAFLDHRIGFMAIPATVERAMERLLAGTDSGQPQSMDDVLATDERARRIASELLAGMRSD